MRVTCSHCGTAYHLDDRLVPSQGARAQCPKCRSLQVVRPEPPRPKLAPRVDPFEPSGGSGSEGLSADLDPFLLDPQAPPARGLTPAGARRAPSASPPRTAAGPQVPCRVCGIALGDPLDAALGICESCRAKEQVDPSPLDFGAPSGAPAAASSSVEVVARSRPAAPAAALPPSVGVVPRSPPAAQRPVGRTPALDAEQLFVDVEEGGQLPGSVPLAPAVSSASAQARSAFRKDAFAGSVHGRGWLGPVLLCLLLLGAAGGGAWYWRAERARLAKVAAPVLPSALEKRVAAWRLAMPNLAGTSSDRAQWARKLFLEDRRATYLEAEEGYKAAVVLDPSSAHAMAGVVEAFAVGRGEHASDAELADARELIDVAIRAAPGSAAVRRAHANLLLAAGRIDRARVEAEEALKVSNPLEQAEALVALGRTYLLSSAPIAREKFEAALQKDPTLRRAYTYRGIAALNAGRFAQALADFEQRLKLDPGQVDAWAAVVRVYEAVGDTAGAKKAVERFAAQMPDAVEPRVLFAEIAWQLEGDLATADRMLKRLKPDLERLDTVGKAQAFAVGAAVARERGDLKAAAESAAAALKLDPRSARARFQLMLVRVDERAGEEARKELAALSAPSVEPARLEEWRGRVEVAAGQFEAASSAFLKSAELGPTRVAPLLCAAAILVKKGDSDAAFVVMKKALDRDPSGIGRAPRAGSELFEPPGEALKPAARAFESLGALDGMWLPQVYAALVQYHRGEVDAAEQALDKALSKDPFSLPALIYRAQIELDRKRFDRAFAFARRAADAERQSAVAQYLLGRALQGQKKAEEARTAYQKALSLDPNLLVTHRYLAQLASAAGDAAAAREELLKVASAVPDDVEVRAALFALGL